MVSPAPDPYFDTLLLCDLCFFVFLLVKNIYVETGNYGILLHCDTGYEEASTLKRNKLFSFKYYFCSRNAGRDCSNL